MRYLGHDSLEVTRWCHNTKDDLIGIRFWQDYRSEGGKVNDEMAVSQYSPYEGGITRQAGEFGGG
jgi:hypothetical protein